MADETTDTRTPGTIHPVLGWPAIAGMAVYAVAWFYSVAAPSLSPWWLLLTIPLLGFLGVMAFGVVWPEARYGVKQADDGSYLAWAFGLCAGGWLFWAGLVGMGKVWTVWLIALAVMWLWFTVLWFRAPHRLRVEHEREFQVATVLQDRAWRGILDRAGCQDVMVTDRREHRGGVVLRLEPVTDRDDAPTFAEFAARAPKIATQAARYFKAQGTPLPRNAIRPEPGDDDAEFLLHVTMRDVFSASTVYVPDATPADIADPRDLGEFEDASRIEVTLNASMKIVGMTGSGKSVLANNLIARTTGCDNALAWVAATDKLMPLIFPWLRCWFDGRAVRPALDYVAGTSAVEVRKLLRAAYRLCCERNDRLADQSKTRATREEPSVIVFVEEVSHAVEFSDPITTHDGQQVSISDLLKMIAQTGRSANVRLVLMTQYGTNPGLGDRASELMRNLPIRICLRTMESHDGYRTLPGLAATVDTTALPLYTLLVQPSIESPKITPGKASELDGSAAIDPVAVRQASWRADGVEALSAAALGPDYAHRWDEGRHEQLSRVVRNVGLSWRVPGQAVEVPAPVPVAVQDNPRDERDEPQGEAVDTADSWTDETDARWRALFEAESGVVDRPAPFELPDSAVGLARLKRIWDEPRPDRTGPADDEPDRVERAQPVPEPLTTVLAWFEALEEIGVEHGPDSWYLTEAIAEGIGRTGDGQRLGIELGRLGASSSNVPRSVDPNRRKGFRVHDLREVAARYRFGL